MPWSTQAVSEQAVRAQAAPLQSGQAGRTPLHTVETQLNRNVCLDEAKATCAKVSVSRVKPSSWLLRFFSRVLFRSQ